MATKEELQKEVAELKAELDELKTRLAEANAKYRAYDQKLQQEGLSEALEAKYEKERTDAKEQQAELRQQRDPLLARLTEIEKLLVPPPAPPALKNKSAERFLTLNRPCGKLPDLQELKSCVVQDLMTNIPVKSNLVERLYYKVKSTFQLGPYDGRVDYVEASSTEEVDLEPVIWAVVLTDVSQQLINGTEDRYHFISHSFIEQVLQITLRYFQVETTFKRNHSEERGTTSTTKSGEKRVSTEKTSVRKKIVHAAGTGRQGQASVRKDEVVGQLRPDWSMYIKNLMFWRGEEKKAGVDLYEAEKDLIQKTRWVPAIMGRLPFLLAYAMAGPRIRLYALHPRDSSADVMLTPICDELDLTKAWHVLQLIKYVINLIPIIVQANAEIETDVPPVGEEWHRASGQFSRITIQPDYVEKQLYDLDDGRIKWEGDGGLKELYKAIEQGKISGTVKLRQPSNEVGKTPKGKPSQNLKLELVPLGYRVTPLKEELRKFLGDILGALASLHANGWVHRDIKLKNVVKTLDGQWILIDLEYARKLYKGEADWPFFDRVGYPMPKRQGEERWRPCHDIQQVAIMLEGISTVRDHPKMPALVKALKESETASKAATAIHVILST